MSAREVSSFRAFDQDVTKQVIPDRRVQQHPKVLFAEYQLFKGQCNKQDQ